MNTQYMKVNPNELVIDLPVDEAKVLELMESIKAYGLLQSPNIWLQEMRIIDGFHRVVACQRLGLTEIDCIVADCSEEAFWDARIIAAKPHSEISDERLAVWMLESWKNSGLSMVRYYDFEVSLPKKERTNDFKALAKVLYDKYFRDMKPNSGIKSIAENAELEGWISEKAQKWGVRKRHLVGKFLTWCGVDVYGSDAAIVDHVAQKLKLPLEKRQIVAREFKNANGSNGSGLAARHSLTEWAKQELVQDKPASYRGFVESKVIPLATDNPKMFDSLLDRFTGGLEEIDIDLVPRAPHRLYALIGFIENKIESSFPDHVQRTKVNPIVAENIELRATIDEQKRRIASLERALNSRQNTVSMFANAVALSSTEIEAA